MIKSFLSLLLALSSSTAACDRRAELQSAQTRGNARATIAQITPSSAPSVQEQEADLSATAACKPRTFDEAVNCLRKTLPKQVRAALLLPDGPVMAHHGFGTMLRNEWHLWDRNSPLSRALLADGFMHPDDMSAAIIDAYVATERGTKFDKAAVIADYRQYWTKMKNRKAADPRECAAKSELGTTPEEIKKCFINEDGSIEMELK